MSLLHKTVSSSLFIWSSNTLLCTVRKIKFEIRDRIRDMICKLFDIVLRSKRPY
jgi:hypothetical protein